jgi:glycolate oxidase
MKYNPVSHSIVEKLIEICGEHYVFVDQEKLEPYTHDETPTEQFSHFPEVVVMPRDTGQVAQIMRLAYKNGIPVTPRGAGSGLSGGAIPVYGGIVVSLEKMNKILEIDTQNMMVTVEPGVITNEVNEKVKEMGLFFAGYPMSVETCFIGGNVAENAGGGRAVKYGVTDRYIMGLEVVLPDGEIISLGGKRVKDVTGYNLKQLFIGSEGTLGIITKIIVKLLPLPSVIVDLLILFKNIKQAIQIVPKIMIETRIIPTSLEFMDQLSVQTSCQYLNEHLPYQEAGAMLLVEVDGNNQEVVEAEAEAIGELCLEQGALEVYVADNYTTQERVWAVRRNIAEAFMVVSPQQSVEDIVVPISVIAVVVEKIQEIAQKYDILIPCYGHAGDGNLHATLVKNPRHSYKKWLEIEHQVLLELYHLIKEKGGTISGEHGIGLKRKDYLSIVCSEEEINLMRKIKKTIDPKNIMNPGKIFEE